MRKQEAASLKRGKSSTVFKYVPFVVVLLLFVWHQNAVGTLLNNNNQEKQQFDKDGWPVIHPLFDGETTDEISCKMVTEREFSSAWLTTALDLIGWKFRIHRKWWEIAYTIHVVKSLKLCEPGKRGLVLAVGKEYLPQFFASMGCNIVATDLPIDDDPQFASAWDKTNQHSAAVESLYYPGQMNITEEKFKELVTYHPENMNNFSEWLVNQEKFDFIWSICSIEHVGSIELGQNVVLNSLDMLKPGGVALHSVEMNLASNTVTKQMKGESVWRKRDIQELNKKVIEKGMEVFPIQWGAGHGYLDRHPDGKLGNYSAFDHLKLYDPTRINAETKLKLVKTSFAMILRKPK